jgi:hypothetical protein
VNWRISGRPSKFSPFEEQQVEQEEDQRAAAGVNGVLDQVERRPAIGEDAAQLPIKIRGRGR